MTNIAQAQTLRIMPGPLTDILRLLMQNITDEYVLHQMATVPGLDFNSTKYD